MLAGNFKKNNLNFFVICLVSLTFLNLTACFNSDDIQNRNTKITVFSDLHYFAEELLINDGPAFQEYIDNDRKLLKESRALLKAAVEAIKNSDAEIVLVPGDLTKDGELVGHQNMAQHLKTLEDAGKTVYVVPGNHDINNPDAFSFDGEAVESVDNVSPAEFRNIYKDFGYDEAIAEDPNSLSYVVEPYNGLRIIAMDSCVYGTNLTDGHPHTEGAFSDETMEWIVSQLDEAKAQGKLVFGMMHHGIVEHFTVQDEFFTEYVINDWMNVSKELADLGMKLVFTGHFHAQDAVMMQSEGGFIFDIETGSLVSYPCAFREMEMKTDKWMIIRSERIKEIDYDTGGVAFREYAENDLTEGIKGLVPKLLAGFLIGQGYSPEEAFAIALEAVETQILPPLALTVKDLVADAMVAHYEGDESPGLFYQLIIDQMISSEDEMAAMLGNAIKSIYDDPDPMDNNLIIDLQTGNAL